ncbi:MAG: GntR family transcriptional regulator [Gammaproteobacteria bacterium]|nr:GntR family transcriptional regulator [Gammaproteobacteria bacterium]
MSLNSQSPVPLYRQLADRILSEIDAGQHAVATKIPSENELADRYSIGRPTVRQATDLLVRQGRLERRRGSGTFVCSPSKTIDLFSLAGTSAALKKSDLGATLEYLSKPCIEIKDLRAHATTEDRWIRIERQVKVKSDPVLHEILWFDGELFAGLEAQTLSNQSLSTLVRDTYFLEPTSADQTFSVFEADDFYSKRLNMNVGTALLKVDRQLHFGDHREALHVEIVCSTDKFAFSQTLFPAAT